MLDIANEVCMSIASCLEVLTCCCPAALTRPCQRRVLSQGSTAYASCCCRYHYNVSSARLDTHIGYGSRDKLTISSLASYTNMWAVVMDCDPQVRLQQHSTGPSRPAEEDAAHTSAAPIRS